MSREPRAGRRSEIGQTAAEYLGAILIVAIIIAAIAASGVGAKVAQGIETAICSIAGGSDCGGSTTAAGGGDLSAPALEQRADDLAAFAATQGGHIEELEAQARAAIANGDLETADRLLDTIALYRDLAGGGRGSLITDVAQPTDADFDALVAQGTIDMGDTNRRYFRVPAVPGDGIIVQDFFIRTETSGGLLRGDNRGLVDPILGDLDLTDSRITITIDRETGRGVITQSETCTRSVLGQNVCQAPRPIELGPLDTRPQVLPSDPNEFDISADGDSIDVDYDALNSITPGIISVDGGITLHRDEDGNYSKGRDTRDRYPARAIFQYRPGEAPRQIDYDPGRDVIGAIPQIDLPDLPNLPDLPDLPDLPGPLPDLPNLPDLPDLPDLPTIP